MNKMRGFTLIELMIVIAILAILAAIIAGGVHSAAGNGSMSVGVTGVVESRCIDGFKYTVDNNGTARQVMDELGHGIRCE